MTYVICNKNVKFYLVLILKNKTTRLKKKKKKHKI